MKYIGHVITLIGVALIVAGLGIDWAVVSLPDGNTISMTAGLGGDSAIILTLGDSGIALGILFLTLGVIAGALAVASIVLQRRALVVNASITFVFLLFLHAWGLTSFDLAAGWRLSVGSGFWTTLAGTLLIFVGTMRVFATGPVISPSSRPLRVATLWNGSIIKELVFDEPRPVTLGPKVDATFTVPEGAGLSGNYQLLTGGKGDKYQLHLTPEMTGKVSIGGTEMTVAEAVEKNAHVDVSGEDWGVLNLGALAMFFQFVKPERAVPAPFFRSMDGNSLASLAFSTVLHLGIILATLFLWEENEEVKRRPVVFKTLEVNTVIIEEEDEEEEEDDGEEEETTAKKAEGDEGKFGDPDIDPMVESKVPENEGKMVSKIDPKKVGLVDVLSSNTIGSIANILSSDTASLSNKMAIAMAGAGTEFVMGHGSGGMGFKGTGTGGGGLGGYGRIHGLGKIDSGGGSGMYASMGKKRAKKVGKIRIGSGKSTGFCKKGDIARVVRRRAGAIRACYEQRLQVKPGLRGKVTARWTIALDGRVRSATPAGNTLSDGAVTSCIMRVIRRMRFTKPEGGVCIVQWPFVFNPGG
ncbi:MAG: AgmX/PglI C-terminal domain-containing protein [Myxococcota bacterium]|nr:AgmX/PglI C-terminal domain-containing protein [Myxococcota bacterium]